MSEALVKRITELKKQRNAVILVHNYQPAEVQDIADFLGDSLDLSRKAAATPAEVIVFCGVHFMAETASILCPDKTVLLPEAGAGCPMAEMITPEEVRALKRKHPGATAVAYINTTAAVKTEIDVCCTSANAAKLVGALPAETVIFVPDRNLGSYVAQKTGKNVILSRGYCPIHMRILPESVAEARRRHPEAEVIVHPECMPEVTAMADAVLSTSGMCRYVRESSRREFIIGTETGILHRMRKENPEKRLYPAAERAVCENMKKNSLEKVLWSLEELKHEVRVTDEVRRKARAAIDQMLAFG